MLMENFTHERHSNLQSEVKETGQLFFQVGGVRFMNHMRTHVGDEDGIHTFLNIAWNGIEHTSAVQR